MAESDTGWGKQAKKAWGTVAVVAVSLAIIVVIVLI